MLSPNSHNVSYSPRQQPTLVQKELPLCLILVGFIHEHGIWGSPGTAPGQGQTRYSFLWVLKLGSCLPWCPCSPVGLQRWAFDGLMTPVVGQRVARAEYCLASPSHCCLSVLCCGHADKLLPHNLTISPTTPTQSAQYKSASRSQLSLLKNMNWLSTTVSNHSCKKYVF